MEFHLDIAAQTHFKYDWVKHKRAHKLCAAQRQAFVRYLNFYFFGPIWSSYYHN